MKTNITAIRVYLDVNGKEEVFVTFTDPKKIKAIIENEPFFRSLVINSASEIKSNYK